MEITNKLGNRIQKTTLDPGNVTINLQKHLPLIPVNTFLCRPEAEDFIKDMHGDRPFSHTLSQTTRPKSRAYQELKTDYGATLQALDRNRF